MKSNFVLFCFHLGDKDIPTSPFHEFQSEIAVSDFDSDFDAPISLIPNNANSISCNNESVVEIKIDDEIIQNENESESKSEIEQVTEMEATSKSDDKIENSNENDNKEADAKSDEEEEEQAPVERIYQNRVDSDSESFDSDDASSTSDDEDFDEDDELYDEDIQKNYDEDTSNHFITLDNFDTGKKCIRFIEF